MLLCLRESAFVPLVHRMGLDKLPVDMGNLVFPLPTAHCCSLTPPTCGVQVFPNTDVLLHLVMASMRRRRRSTVTSSGSSSTTHTTLIQRWARQVKSGHPLHKQTRLSLIMWPVSHIAQRRLATREMCWLAMLSTAETCCCTSALTSKREMHQNLLNVYSCPCRTKGKLQEAEWL